VGLEFQTSLLLSASEKKKERKKERKKINCLFQYEGSEFEIVSTVAATCAMHCNFDRLFGNVKNINCFHITHDTQYVRKKHRSLCPEILYGLEVTDPGYRYIGPGSFPDVKRFSEK
jgi:hypothetical protein